MKYPKSFIKRLQPRWYDTETNGIYDHYVQQGFPEQDAYEYLNAEFNKYPDSYNVYAGQLPEVTVTPDKGARNDVVLTTYYPGVSEYWATGHSRLDTPGGNTIDVMSDDPEYNLVLNNCSDATRQALEQATGRKINPLFFTTPGDVKSFAEDILGGRSFDNGDGSVQTFINLPQYQINKIAKYAQDLRNKRRLHARQHAEAIRNKRLIAIGPHKNTE